MTEATANLINITIQVFLVSLWIAIPIIIMLILMYSYKKYKKWESREVKEAERIIVKKNEQILYQTNAITTLEKTKEQLQLAVEELEKEKRSKAIELGIDVDAVKEAEDNKVEVKQLTIKELQDIAKSKGIRGFSRMKKDKLIELLST